MPNQSIPAMKSAIQNLISASLKQSKSLLDPSRCDSNRVINMLLLNCSSECETRFEICVSLSRQTVWNPARSVCCGSAVYISKHYRTVSSPN